MFLYGYLGMPHIIFLALILVLFLILLFNGQHHRLIWGNLQQFWSLSMCGWFNGVLQCRGWNNCQSRSYFPKKLGSYQSLTLGFLNAASRRSLDWRRNYCAGCYSFGGVSRGWERWRVAEDVLLLHQIHDLIHCLISTDPVECQR